VVQCTTHMDTTMMVATVEDVVEAVELVAAAVLDVVAAVAIVNMETIMLVDGVAQVVVIINKATTIAMVTMRTTAPTLPAATATTTMAVPIIVNNQFLKRRLPSTDRAMAHRPVQPLLTTTTHQW
jgi:hypothetical protein